MEDVAWGKAGREGGRNGGRKGGRKEGRQGHKNDWGGRVEGVKGESVTEVQQMTQALVSYLEDGIDMAAQNGFTWLEEMIEAFSNL